MSTLIQPNTSFNPISTVPGVPYNLSVSNLLSLVQLTSAVTLSTPTSATLITGMVANVTPPVGSSLIRITVSGKGVTITAAATITLGAYQATTTGTLSTLIGTQVRLGATGGTVCDINGEVYSAVTPTMWASALWINFAAAASTGNYVTQASSTEPTNLAIT